MAKVKTNAMRILDKADILYDVHTYDHSDGSIDGISVAQKIERPVEQVYKTLVTQGTSKEYYVFMIPVVDELDLKAAARAVAEKSIEMIKIADINKITGYIRGGCSPMGMKKDYKAVLDSSCQALNTVIVSAGKLGYQIELKPEDLMKVTRCKIESITMGK
ncbi:ybaK/ebsC protein [Alkaliphilus metalliredigens QYMF]|uniref:Cys-tRNA(Pro)/Cys-tRNA(Cys) deacylase n=1 Tax=Alkaliphilus metalliredigens (strain QYMF) TaxID=293826 RepID=A6TTW3_ALKMQ|nr:Cys-tRNA(Pro) deacylase [Alkaliphilus metalliredigens]ABR49631.1 ybaK/ebsC protein [Alkaliphilus metalliredigens QYMF]